MRSRRAIYCALLLGAIVHIATTQALAGKLDRAGGAARSGSSSSSSSSSGSSYGGGGSGSGADPTLLIYGTYYLLLGATSPWWAPHQVMEGELPPGTTKARRFADYPYAEGAAGHVIEPVELVNGWDGEMRSPSRDAIQPRLLQRVSAQLGLESGIGISDGITRFGLRGRIQFPMRLQLDADWSMLHERDRQGFDTAYMGREHLSVRFAESSQLQFYTGIGPQHFCDAIGCEHGVDLTWGFDAFPGRPIALGIEGSVGNLGYAFAPGVRARLGVLVGPVEASIGWHQRWVDAVPLGGPFIGIGGWF